MIYNSLITTEDRLTQFIASGKGCEKEWNCRSTFWQICQNVLRTFIFIFVPRSYFGISTLVGTYNFVTLQRYQWSVLTKQMDTSINVVHSWTANSVTRLDNFWNFLTINFLTKVVPTIWWLLDYFEKHQFCSKNCGDYFLGNILGKLGYFVFQHLVTLTANYNLAFKCRTNVLLQNCSLLLYLTVNWKTIIRWFLTSSKIFAKKLFIKLICH